MACSLGQLVRAPLTGNRAETVKLSSSVVFTVQVGRTIGAAPWWITLATAGAALLVLAATSERRTAGSGARLRDLG